MNLPNTLTIDQLRSIDNLPSPKGVALEVVRLTHKDDVTNQELARAIKADPALSSRVIKVANLLVSYQTRPIASVVDAVSVLGLGTLRNLVLGLSLIENNLVGTCARFDYQDFWARSLLTAIAAQNFAFQGSGGSSEEIFILGLLGKIGTLAFATARPQQYAQLLEQANGQALAELEQHEFGYDHNQLTQAMLAEWGMPKLFQEIALHHEHPRQSGFAEGDRGWHLTNVLHLADRLSAVCLAQEASRRQMVPELVLTASRQGIEMEALARTGEKVLQEWQKWAGLLGIQAIEMPPFAALFEAAPLPSDSLEEEVPCDDTTYKLRILLVDDDRVTLHLQKSLLEKCGHTVMTAENGEEGLAATAQFLPQLIITDWQMPQMDGLEFCRALRRNPAWRNIYVFVLTSQEGVENMVEAFDAGANDYMAKPIGAKALLARLRAGQRVVQLQEEVESDRRQLHEFSTELADINLRLRNSDASMRAILDNSPYVAWLKDADGRYVQANKNYVEFVRRQDDRQIIGKTDADIWPEALAKKYAAIDAEVIASRQSRRYEESFRKGNEIRWLETVKTPAIDENGKVFGITGFVRDITDKVNREEQRLAEVKKQRDALVREVHHRIKNNLQGVIGLFRQLGSDHPEIEGVIDVFIGKINSIATIHGLQAQNASEAVDLGKLMASIIDASGCRIDYANRLERTILLNPEESVPIALVLNELHTNACKHRSADACPTVELRMSGADAVVTVTNQFDARKRPADGDGQGLKLARSLLPPKATNLAVSSAGNLYTAELKLSPPAIAAK